MVGRNFALFHFGFEGKFQVQASPGGGFLLYEFVGLIFEGVKGLFSQFYGISGSSSNAPPQFKKMGRSVG